MKIFKFLGIFALLFVRMDQYQMTIAKALDIEQAMPLVIESLNNDLEKFRKQYDQLNYGISSIKSLYDSGLDIEKLYGTKKSHSCSRLILSNLEILAGGSCGVLKCLSVFHPDIDAFGKALIGCYIGKAIFWGADAMLHNSAKQASIALIKTAQANSEVVSHFSKIIDEVNKIDFSPILNLSKKVINIMKQKNLSGDNLKKLARLQTLTDKMSNHFSFKKFAVTGGKILSFITGAASGITIAATGQYSEPSYWLTLITGALDPMVDCINIQTTKKPIIRRYITLSEIIYLCDNFINEYSKADHEVDGQVSTIMQIREIPQNFMGLFIF